MAADAEWGAVEEVLRSMQPHGLYQPTINAMRPLIESLKADPAFDDVHAIMTNYGFFLSLGKTETSVIVGG
jgi:hypothetical protein